MPYANPVSLLLFDFAIAAGLISLVVMIMACLSVKHDNYFWKLSVWWLGVGLLCVMFAGYTR